MEPTNAPDAAARGWIGDAGKTGDAALATRVASGEPAALGEVYDRHARAVYSLAWRLLGERAEAEDVVQEVFTQAWRQAGSYDARRGSLVAWLLMIARSRALDRLRARRARISTVPFADGAEGPADPGVTPEAHAAAAQGSTRLRAALEALGEEQRTALQLAYYEGLSYSEVADRLQAPLGTIKTRIRTALQRLAQALEGQAR